MPSTLVHFASPETEVETLPVALKMTFATNSDVTTSVPIKKARTVGSYLPNVPYFLGDVAFLILYSTVVTKAIFCLDFQTCWRFDSHTRFA